MAVAAEELSFRWWGRPPDSVPEQTAAIDTEALNRISEAIWHRVGELGNIEGVGGTIAALRYGESVHTYVDTMGYTEGILPQWRVEIDNHLCENTLRVGALGGRNYMFFGSESSGDSAAIMYSLIVNCKLNGIEPEDVISVISTWHANRVNELYPWNATLPAN